MEYTLEVAAQMFYFHLFIYLFISSIYFYLYLFIFISYIREPHLRSSWRRKSDEHNDGHDLILFPRLEPILAAIGPHTLDRLPVCCRANI